MAFRDYIRKRFFPHIWCPGCGHGVILNNMLRAFDKMQLNKEDMVVVSGIGCSSRISGYIDANTLHTIHGRALAFATGVKFANPKLKVIVPMGDGDALSIGGNHFIHAARRNIDITAIIMNNRIYGMTGGQYSPLSGEGVLATTSPHGNIDPAFDTVQMAIASGATFVARSTSAHPIEIANLVEKAMNHKGFSVLEVLSSCPTYFGRKNGQGDAVDMLKYLKDNSVPITSNNKDNTPPEMVRGIFVDNGERNEYCDLYQQIIDTAGKKEKKGK